MKTGKYRELCSGHFETVSLHYVYTLSSSVSLRIPIHTRSQMIIHTG